MQLATYLTITTVPCSTNNYSLIALKCISLTCMDFVDGNKLSLGKNGGHKHNIQCVVKIVCPDIRLHKSGYHLLALLLA